MKKTILIALLLCIMASGCDSPFTCKPWDDGMTFILYKYNTGEQYRNNVLYQSHDSVAIPKEHRYFFHNGYSHCGSILEAGDTSEYHILSLKYDDIDTMSNEWKTRYQNYIIPNVRISEMYRVYVCGCRKHDCYYTQFPFCTKGSSSINYDFFSFDSTIINQMIDDGTMWNYFKRII